MAWSNSVVYGATPAGAVVRMHPGAASGDADADTVTLTTEHGSITAHVAYDETVREGVVSITHGHAAENPGDLTSENVDIDALTAMPRASGLDVSVIAVAKAEPTPDK